MTDISNKTLAALLIVAIAIGFVGLLSFKPTTTGAYDETGTARVNITEQVSIILDTTSLDFGDGWVNKSAASCSINSSTGEIESSNCVGFSAPPTGFILRNDGNTNVSVTLNGSTAADFIGGTSPEYKFLSQDNEAGSCTSGLVASYTSISGSPQTICSNLLYTDATDSMEIKIHIKIPDDALTGLKTDNVTFTATP